MKIKNYANGVMVLCDNNHVLDTVPYGEWAGSRQEARYMESSIVKAFNTVPLILTNGTRIEFRKLS